MMGGVDSVKEDFAPKELHPIGTSVPKLEDMESFKPTLQE